MEFVCVRCDSPFDAARPRGYCGECVSYFRDVAAGVRARQHPLPGVHCDGKFTDEDCPSSVTDPVTGSPVCGLCGSELLEHGYGLGSGRGIGSYLFCGECYAFLDFSEDRS